MDMNMDIDYVNFHVNVYIRVVVHIIHIHSNTGSYTLIFLTTKKGLKVETLSINMTILSVDYLGTKPRYSINLKIQLPVIVFSSIITNCQGMYTVRAVCS
jgi:hypothetical protein